MDIDESEAKPTVYTITLKAFKRCIENIQGHEFIIRFREKHNTFTRYKKIRDEGPRYPDFFGSEDDHESFSLDDPFGDRVGFAVEAGHRALLNQIFMEARGCISIHTIDLKLLFSAKAQYRMFADLVLQQNVYVPLFPEGDEKHERRLSRKKSAYSFTPFSVIVSKNGSTPAALKELREKIPRIHKPK